jgi:hypothetical protein
VSSKSSSPLAAALSVVADVSVAAEKCGRDADRAESGVEVKELDSDASKRVAAAIAKIFIVFLFCLSIVDKLSFYCWLLACITYYDIQVAT